MKINPLPSKAILDKLLLFRPSTGDFFWKINRSNIKAGTKAGCIVVLRNKPYVQIRIGGVSYLAHRIAFFLATGLQPQEIDHKNGNGLDNRPENLRISNRKDNQNNCKKQENNITGVVGVSYNKHNRIHPWECQFGGREFKKKHKTHKCFKTFEEAVAQRKAWEDMYGMTEIKKHLKPSP